MEIASKYHVRLIVIINLQCYLSKNSLLEGALSEVLPSLVIFQDGMVMAMDIDLLINIKINIIL